MHMLDHLIKEHREAERLMAALADGEPGPERERTLDELEEALQVHMGVEERFLYPIVEQVIGGETTEEATIEHGLGREGVARLRELVDQPGFGAAVDMLQAGISHHVDEEEKEIFPKLRKEAGDQLAELDPDELEMQIKQDHSTSDVDLTKEELYERAQEADIPGRSGMSRNELAEALRNQ